MAVIKINHVKSGGQVKSCISLNVKVSIFVFCKGKLIQNVYRCHEFIWFFSMFVIFLIKCSN